MFAVQKFVQIEESPGVIGNHHMTVEIGTKYIDSTGHEEYYIEYNYRTVGGEIVKVGINMLMDNRDPYSESASPFQISLKLELTNPQLPKFLNDLRDKNNPEELTITDADYIFNINGEYETVVATGKHDESKQTFVILKSYVNHPKYAFLKEVFQNVDLSRQRLDGLTTLDNLLKNINFTHPVNPLTLLAFHPPTTEVASNA